MSKVVIVLEGGLVQSVHSDDERVQVAVLDHDIFEDIDPKVDLDGFFTPELDPELIVLRKWQKKKAEFLSTFTQSDEVHLDN